MTPPEKLGYQIGSLVVKFKRWQAPTLVKITSLLIAFTLFLVVFFDVRNEKIFLSTLGGYIIWGVVLFVAFKFRYQLRKAIANFFVSPEVYHLRKLREEVRDLKEHIKGTEKNEDKIITDISLGIRSMYKYDKRK